MDLSEQYRKQSRFRSWPTVFVEHVRKQLLAALVHPEHCSLATVQCVIALAPMMAAESSA